MQIDSKVHGANMGPIWGLQGTMLAPWTLLSGVLLSQTVQELQIYMKILPNQ